MFAEHGLGFLEGERAEGLGGLSFSDGNSLIFDFAVSNNQHVVVLKKKRE